jgi:hypothetical protein
VERKIEIPYNLLFITTNLSLKIHSFFSKQLENANTTSFYNLNILRQQILLRRQKFIGAIAVLQRQRLRVIAVI